MQRPSALCIDDDAQSQSASGEREGEGDLAEAEVNLLSAIGGQTRRRAALGKLPHPYDCILIDTPPSLGLLTINALTAAQELLIPMAMEYLALRGLGAGQDSEPIPDHHQLRATLPRHPGYQGRSACDPYPSAAFLLNCAY
jgi:cellulose biosynthesis protein BcsQ